MSDDAYLLGKLDERKVIAHYLVVRAGRALLNGGNVPWWAFYRRARHRWAAVGHAIIAREIESGDHVTDQAVWLVELKDGVIIGRCAERENAA